MGKLVPQLESYLGYPPKLYSVCTDPGDWGASLSAEPKSGPMVPMNLLGGAGPYTQLVSYNNYHCHYTTLNLSISFSSHIHIINPHSTQCSSHFTYINIKTILFSSLTYFYFPLANTVLHSHHLHSLHTILFTYVLTLSTPTHHDTTCQNLSRWKLCRFF